MPTLTTEPLFQVLNGKPRLKLELKTTMDYNMFKRMKGNRDMSRKNLERLKESYERNPIPKPVLVNEKLEIVDGQHTVQICRELGLPVYYYAVPGLTLKDVQLLNQTVTKWTPNDHMESQVESGNKQYKIYQEFKEKWKFGHSNCLLLLAGGKTDNTHADFRDGLFKVKNLEWAESSAEKLYDIEKFYSGFKRSSFVLAMLYLFNNKLYKHSQFLQKLQVNSHRMVHCTTRTQYVKMIENIYNWKNHEKVRFI